MLVPARLDRENVESPWTLGLEDQEVASNHSLVQLLIDDFGVKLPPVPRIWTRDPERPRRLLRRGPPGVRDLPRWEVLDEAALGIFSFQKVAMWEDLGRTARGSPPTASAGPSRATSPPCRRVARRASRTPPNWTAPSAREQTFHILDADSSQHEAIEAARRGKPGPRRPAGHGQEPDDRQHHRRGPGRRARRSCSSARRRRPWRSSSGGSTRSGLGDFCLECHSHKANKKAVIAELGRCLGPRPARSIQDQAEELARLFETRAKLNAYVRSLHERGGRSGLSPFQVHGRLAEILEEVPVRRAARYPTSWRSTPPDSGG